MPNTEIEEVFFAPHLTLNTKSAYPRCNHLDNYGLTCQEADALWTRARCRCEICGVTDRDAPYGLNIDHNCYVGYNAVRGVLCTTCNQTLDDPRRMPWKADFAYNAAHYLLNEWYRRPGAPPVYRRKPMRADFKFGYSEDDALVHPISSWRRGSTRSGCGVRLTWPSVHAQVDDRTLCPDCDPAESRTSVR